ncbi:hypothetical protein BDZ88DRAFT_408538 [Geranomyces variabilis]|nr:hypothetical protein BDZ88DRAFT_408538 [Geranomyces variabilis]KAJ3142147.1 G patch domain-containing protein 4 [Geranomyces variabilis]
MPSYTDADEGVRSGMGSDSNFAQSQLAKYGWEKGTGLGKHRDGINKAISVGFKNDTDGLGAKSDEWSFAWWDHVFNKSAASIKIHKDSDDDAVAVSAAADSQAAKKLLYGTFVKATPAEEVIVERKDYSIKVTDEELFLACEGRTARKGARSSQPGKLARAGMSPAAVAEAMEAAAAVLVADVPACTPKEEKRLRKEQRAARRAEKAARRERRAARKTQAAATSSPSEATDFPPPEREEKKAKKAKKNKVEQREETLKEEVGITVTKVEKKKKRKEKEVAVEPIATPEASAGKKEKKRKRKGCDDAQEPPKKLR